MFHHCTTFSFSGAHVLCLKSINDPAAFAALGICSQHLLTIFEIEFKYCATNILNKGKYVITCFTVYDG